MRQPLYKDVDVSTMRNMREEQGMTNSEIAEALGVTRETVWHYLGAGPRKKTYTKQDKAPTPHKPMTELFPSVSTEVTLTGKRFVYRVRPDKPDVTLDTSNLYANGVALSAEDLDALLEELQYIRRTYMR